MFLQVAGGPKIPVRYGRMDASGPEDSPPEGNLPGVSTGGNLLILRPEGVMSVLLITL